jgi:hypothetical protein
MIKVGCKYKTKVGVSVLNDLIVTCIEIQSNNAYVCKIPDKFKTVCLFFGDELVPFDNVKTNYISRNPKNEP